MNDFIDSQVNFSIQDVQKMQIGILARDYSNHLGRFGVQDYFFRECCTECQAIGLELFVFSPDGLRAEENAIDGFRLEQNEWAQHRFAIPPVVYDRCFFYDLRERIAARLALRQLKQQFFINPIAIIDLANNKWDCHRFMIRNRIDTPFSFKAQNSFEILDFVDEQGGAFLKPEWGMKGMDILFISKTRDTEFYDTECNGAIETLDRQNLMTRINQVSKTRARGLKDFLVQKVIKVPTFQDRFFDIRVLAQKNASLKWQITGAAARISPLQSRIANLRAGSTVETLENVFLALNLDFNATWPKIEELTFGLCSCLEKRIAHFGELGLDFLVDAGARPWLVEFNARPGRFIFTQLADRSDLSWAQRNTFREIRRQAVLNPFLYAQAYLRKLSIFT